MGPSLSWQLCFHDSFITQAKLYQEKRSDLEEQQLHLNIGLQKIHDTVKQVGELQKSLSVKRIELEEKNNAANSKLKQMVSRFRTSFDIYLWILFKINEPHLEKTNNVVSKQV